MRACSLPDDFTPLPPPQINYRSRESEEGAAAARPRHASRSQACPSVNSRDAGDKSSRREFLRGGLPRGERSFPSLEGKER